MYLMYTLDADGKRVYTLKVRERGVGERGRRDRRRRLVKKRRRRLRVLSPTVEARDLRSHPRPHLTQSGRTGGQSRAGVGGAFPSTRGSARLERKKGDATAPPPPPCVRPTLPSLSSLTPSVPRPPPCLSQKYVGDTPTHSAHPARFSPDDKFSRERVECKRRFGLLPTQKPAPVL